jgi:D-alanyl-D-alanine carboxypeptidase
MPTVTAPTAHDHPSRPRVRRHRGWIVVAVAVLVAAVAVPVTLVGMRADRVPVAARPELQRVLVELISGSGRIAPGATAYVAGPHGSWSGAAGVADATTGQPMAVDARMRLESVSKIWTAVLVLQLAEHGRLGLNDKVERWLPGLLPFGDRITLRQLLTHTSGIFDNNDAVNHPARVLTRVKDPVLHAELVRLAKRLQADPTIQFPPTVWIRLAATQPLYFPPGTGYHYSNVGFEVLGLVLERVTGQPLEAVYRERILRPLGLAHTAYDPQGEITGPHARGYLVNPDGSLADMTAVHWGIGAEGGIVSSAADTARFLTALMQDRLLGPVAAAGMRTGDFWSGGDTPSCGGSAYGHSGAGEGYKTNVWVSSDGRRVVVLLLNGRMADSDAGNRRAAQALDELYCSAPSSERPVSRGRPLGYHHAGDQGQPVYTGGCPWPRPRQGSP